MLLIIVKPKKQTTFLLQNIEHITVHYYIGSVFASNIVLLFRRVCMRSLGKFYH